MKIWITSDTHFNHANVIKYCGRPFSTVEEMNDAIISNWNKYISKEDIVIFCGDFCFSQTAAAQEQTQHFASLLNGYKIIIKGNHDFKKFKYINAGFKAEFYQRFEFGRFLFCHSPYNLNEWRKQFEFVFYGHVHNTPIKEFKAFDNTKNVCQDVNDFRPIDITHYFTVSEIKQLKQLVNY